MQAFQNYVFYLGNKDTAMLKPNVIRDAYVVGRLHDMRGSFGRSYSFNKCHDTYLTKCNIIYTAFDQFI